MANLTKEAKANIKYLTIRERFIVGHYMRQLNKIDASISALKNRFNCGNFLIDEITGGKMSRLSNQGSDIVDKLAPLLTKARTLNEVRVKERLGDFEINELLNKMREEQ